MAIKIQNFAFYRYFCLQKIEVIQSSLLSNCCSVWIWRIQLTVLENNTLVLGTRDDAKEGLVRTPVQFNVRTIV